MFSNESKDLLKKKTLRCSGCKEIKSIKEFYRNRSVTVRNGHDALCKLCRDNYMREWRIKKAARLAEVEILRGEDHEIS